MIKRNRNLLYYKQISVKYTFSNVVISNSILRRKRISHVFNLVDTIRKPIFSNENEIQKYCKRNPLQTILNMLDQYFSYMS